MQKWTIYFISDHTGITIESLGKTLLSQFDNIDFEFKTIPFVDDLSKANALIQSLEDHANNHNVMIFSSIVTPELRDCFNKADFIYFDLFSAFLPKLEKTFDQEAVGVSGRIHSALDYHKYMTRIEAINYALSHDDGLNANHYDKADIILVGASRSGKTPTCLYLAIQFGICAANYPLTEEDLRTDELPDSLCFVLL